MFSLFLFHFVFVCFYLLSFLLFCVWSVLWFIVCMFFIFLNFFFFFVLLILFIPLIFLFYSPLPFTFYFVHARLDWANVFFPVFTWRSIRILGSQGKSFLLNIFLWAATTFWRHIYWNDTCSFHGLRFACNKIYWKQK